MRDVASPKPGGPSIGEHSSIDAELHRQARGLYTKLSLEGYCRHASTLLNAPTLQNHIETSAGIRAICESQAVTLASPDALISVSLLYIVALCEGIVMPHLQPLITLAEEQGLCTSSERLERARNNFGPAISLLAQEAAPMFHSIAPSVGARIQEYEATRLSRLRNSIAHLKFRLEIVRTRLRDAPGFPTAPMEVKLLEGSFNFLSNTMDIPNPHAPQIVDLGKSRVRYQDTVQGRLTKNSPALTFWEVREKANALEQFAFSLMFAYLEANKSYGSRLFSGTCSECREGFVAVPATMAEATCPACGHRSTTTLVD
jgi:hypothetical protein